MRPTTKQTTSSSNGVDNSHNNGRQSSLSFLDWLAVASSLVVLGLFVQHANKIAGYPRLVIMFDSTTSPKDSSKTSLLSGHCSDAVEHFKNVTSRQHAPEEPPPQYTAFYEQAGAFCARIPAGLSPAKLWNDHLGRVLRAATSTGTQKHSVHDHEELVAAHLVTSQLLRFLTPHSYLELGVRAPPAGTAWGKILNKVQARMERGAEVPMVQVVFLGATASGKGEEEGDDEWCDLPLIDTNTDEDDADLERTPQRRLENIINGTAQGRNQNCHWPFLLARLVNNLLRSGHSKAPIVNVTVIAHPGHTATSELATDIVRHDLWPPHLRLGGPDVIVNAYAAQDMFFPARGYQAASDVQYYHHQRTITQDFIRACLLRPKSCGGQPLVIHLNDYVGGQHGAVLAETIKARALQQMSDYYSTALVSYADLIQRLVYATSSLDDDFDTEKSLDVQRDLLLQHGWTRQTGITITMAYAFLHYTIQYCANRASEMQQIEHLNNDRPIKPMIPPETFQLIQDTVPPELNLDLTLFNVSAMWRHEQERQEQQHASAEGTACPKCELAFWGPTTMDSLDEFIKENDGWNVQIGEPLVAQHRDASLRLRVPLPQARTGTPIIRMFTTRQDAASLSTASRLHWEVRITSGTTNRHRHSGRGRHLQQTDVWKTSGFINGTHDSPSIVTLPHVIEIGPEAYTVDNHTSTVDLKLKLVEGDRFEVVAIVVC